ncbi:hypothetical protein [Streptomyces sp. NPDC029721]|uniref:hypothetical protein n=1 Tax=unclassified Streptomyces TaxID=2593676 RepID=UPI0033E66397
MAAIAPHHRTTAATAARPRPGVLRSRFVRRVGHAALLLPAVLGTAGAVVVGRADAARRWWARSGELGAAARAGHAGPGGARLLAHSLLCLPLGLLALIPLGMQVLFVLRGMLYPVVQAGPYTNAWGGPSLAGAWLAHFGVGLLSAVVGLGVLWSLNRLHARLAGGMWGRRVGVWPVLAVAAASAAGMMLVVAWTHQI